VSETTLKRIKKRREKVGKLVYDEKDDWTDGDVRSNMREIRNITAPTSITIQFNE
jgi:hypothetical protein